MKKITFLLKKAIKIFRNSLDRRQQLPYFYDPLVQSSLKKIH